MLWYANSGTAADCKELRATLKWLTDEEDYREVTKVFPRNPQWLSGGIEIDGHIHWSQPELVLYDPVRFTMFSYPDMIQEGNKYWITETNKGTARVHAIDSDLINGLWTQGQVKTVAKDGLVLEYAHAAAPKSSVTMPKLPNLKQGGGISVEFSFTTTSPDAGQIIADSRDPKGKGILIQTTADGAVELILHDGERTARWSSDPGTIRPGRRHHVVAVVDGGPNIISFVVDGIFNDGGTVRECGFGWFDADLGDVNGGDVLRLAPSLNGSLRLLRIYDRPLRVSEAIGNFHAGE